MNFSPRATSNSTILSAAANSSPDPIVYKLGFYGAGSTTGFGNLWFKQFANDAGVTKLYVHNDGNNAMWDFLKAIDKNNNKVITQEEVSNLTLKVCGYSWGGISAIGFTQKIASPGKIQVGGTPHQPIEYTLEVGISVNVLVTVDPVEWLNPAGTVQNNVKKYQNWYQLKGGYSIFRKTNTTREIGNSFSDKLKGDAIQVQAPLTFNGCNTRVDSPNLRTRTGAAFLIDGDPTIWSLRGDETNHDGMPWLVGDLATGLLL